MSALFVLVEKRQNLFIGWFCQRSFSEIFRAIGHLKERFVFLFPWELPFVLKP